MASNDDTAQDNESADDFWDPILDGQKDPVKIIYVAAPSDDFDLSEIEEWGAMTGMWEIRRVFTCDEAATANERDNADLIILLDPCVEDARAVSRRFPHTPLSVAASGGWDKFPDGWPAQVVVAQWAVPRPTEFMDGVADALSRVSTRIIYNAVHPAIEVFTAVSEELLARLAVFPEDRFRLDPRVFEEAVAELLARMGYETRLTPRSGDKGRDVIACLRTPASPMLMLVECKRYAASRKVGPEPITRLWYRLFDDHANMAMVVTTSGFQPIAKETARNRGYQVSLKEGEDFIQWVRSLRSR